MKSLILLTLLAGTHSAVAPPPPIVRPVQPIVRLVQYRSPYRYWGPYFFDDHEWDGPEYGNQGAPPPGWGYPYGDRGTIHPGQMFDEQTWRFYHGPWGRPRPWGPRW